MAWTCYQICLAVLMFVSGTINTLSTKWADKTSSLDSTGHMRPFDHPFLQAVGMFLGELSCLFVFHIIRLVNKVRNKPMELGNQNFNPLIFLPPALCDMCGTSIMYLGLNLTYASSFQMLRGAVIVFTALLSVAFLGRIIKTYMWVGIFWVIAGLALVGVADVVFGDHDKSDTNGIIAGDLLIIMAQIIVAVQMVVEEKFVMKHNVPPLQAVGWEGFFGFTILGILLVPMYYIDVGHPFSDNPEGRLEDAIDGFIQISNSWIVALATFGNIVSIAFFNFSGISVTKEMSATTRMVLDSLRTASIWVVTLAVGWQTFQYLQLIGFFLLFVGMCLYNDIIILPLMRKYGVCGLHPPEGEEGKRLVTTSGDEDVSSYKTIGDYGEPNGLFATHQEAQVIN
ncbi:solute carrier family 35 member F6 [Lingula anatina]|uniref:Solute carrier family 35 member F6 n=1 Tax=Lingula anatina TaxID=7574 RepID=A0A1S3ITM5_LINAN|nr:solute carrier family 35 member F6 [Lingula anatina]|eukprot:XP_013400884.1 solute carrier family 35 member F6 [Lingula anatina]